jgi:hypothetical protein
MLLLKYGDVTVNRLIDAVHLAVQRKPRKALRKSLNKYHGDVCDIFGMDASTIIDDSSDDEPPPVSPPRRGGLFDRPHIHFGDPLSTAEPSAPIEAPSEVSNSSNKLEVNFNCAWTME